MARLDWARVARSFLGQLSRHNITFDAVDDGDGYEPIPRGTSLIKRIKYTAEALTAVDEAWLQISYNDQKAKLFFVFGNDPDEILADWAVNSTSMLSAMIDTANDNFMEIWSGKPCPTLPEEA